MADAQNDAFFSTLTRSIEQAAMKVGDGVKFSFSAFGIEEEATRRLILNHDVDGAAVLGRCDKKTMNFLREHFSKVVYAGLNELDMKCDQVICDGRAAALDVMGHLRKLGHSRIGYVGDTKNEIRYLAYREALKGRGISYLGELVASAGGHFGSGIPGGGAHSFPYAGRDGVVLHERRDGNRGDEGDTGSRKTRSRGHFRHRH